MKKLYTLALAAAVTLSAAAFELRPKTEFSKLPAKQMIAADQLKLTSKTPQKAPSRALTMDDIVGTYDWNGYDMFDGVMTSTSIEIVAHGTDSVQIVVEEFVDSDFNTPITAAVDFAAGTLSIPSGQFLGHNAFNNFDVYFIVMTINEAGDDVIDNTPGVPIVGQFDENGSVVFPDEELLAIGNSDAGYFLWMAYNSFDAPAPEPEMPGTWTSAGKATFVDGWMIPGIVNQETGVPYDQYSFPWIVDVERCVEEPTVFRLVNPYGVENSPIPGYEGYIAFDLANPNFVPVIPGYPCGYSNGTNKLRCTNIEGYYMDQEFTEEDIREAFAEDDFTYSTYSEGRVLFQNCKFNYKGTEDKIYSWQYRATNGEVVSCVPLMHGEAVFDVAPEGIDNSGVSSVTVDNNAPAVYYNLQGMRVDNPSNGIYIRKQGNTVTKVMAK